MKYYRDLKNVVDMAYEEGREEEQSQVILRSHAAGIEVETIVNITGKSKEEIKAILKKFD